MFNKKGFITSPSDLMKGLFIGFIIGVVLVYLGAKNVIPLPLL